MTDGSGEALGEPLVLADGIDNIGGVDVAWSGEALLVVYWDIDMTALPVSSLLHARIVELGR